MNDPNGTDRKMKVVILAGGMGTRLGEETVSKPKPMVEIGGRPILWHIMKTYSAYGFDDFVICCGYKGPMIKNYFVNYCHYRSDCTYLTKTRQIRTARSDVEPWRVTLVNTGLKTMTAGRILRAREYIGEEPFLLTYGDGVADLDLNALVDFHKNHGKTVTISTTQPPGRFGAVSIGEDGTIGGFKEKARKDQSWVNIGYMVCEPEVYNYLGDGSEMLESGPFERLASAGEMAAYKHPGFWSPMDTIHDRDYLEQLLSGGSAPWLK